MLINEKKPRQPLRMLHLIWIATLLVGAAACATNSEKTGGSSISTDGTTSDGDTLFRQSVIGGFAGCATCHSLEPGVTLIGPSLAGIGALAEQRVQGQTAADYLRAAIIEPDAYIVEGYPKGIMPSGYSEQLSEDQVDSLVAYLLTLK